MKHSQWLCIPAAWHLLLAAVVIAMAAEPTPVLAQTAAVSENETLIFFLHEIAAPPATGSSEEHDHALGNIARTLGISVPELEAVASAATAYKTNENDLKLEARQFTRERTATQQDLRRFSDQRLALAVSAFGEIERKISPKSYQNLKAYVLSTYRQSIETWR